MDISTLGIAVDSRQVSTAADQLNRMADAGAKAETAAGSLADTSKQAGAAIVAAINQQTAAADKYMQMLAAEVKQQADVRAQLAAVQKAYGDVNSQLQATRAQLDAITEANKRASGATDSHVEAYRKVQEAGEKYVQGLRDELAVIGKTRAEIEAYKTAQGGLSDAHQKAAAALGTQIDAAKKAAAEAANTQSVWGELGSKGVAIAGALAGAFAAISFAGLIKDSAMLAARFETMGVVMGVAGNNAGYTRQQMDAYSKSLQDSGISMLQSRNILTQLATAHIDLANAQKLGRAAQDLAVVGNINSSEALERMVHGIKSGELEVLRTMGLNVNFEDGYKKLAQTLGITTEGLTEQQKVLSRTNTALEAAAAYQGIYEESMTTAGKAMTSLTRYWEDFKVKAGEAFLPALATSVFDLTDALKAANAELEKAGGDGTLASVGDILNGAVKTGLQTVAVLAANVGYVFAGIGREIGGISAQAAALATGGGLSAAANIRKEMLADNEAAEAALKAFEDRMMGVTTSTKEVTRMSEDQRIAAGKARQAEQDAQDAAAKTDAARKKFMTEFGSDSQKFDEAVKKWKSALGDTFTDKDVAALREKFFKKTTADAAAAAKDATNAEIEELKRGQLVKDEISKRGAAALAVQYKVGDVDELSYIRAVAVLDLQRLDSAGKALQQEMDIAEKKKNSRKEVERLEGELALNQEKRLTREQQLQNDITLALYAREQATKQLYNAAENQDAKDLLSMQERNKATADEIEGIGMTAKELQRLTERRMDAAIARKQQNIEDMAGFAITDEQIAKMDQEIAKLEEMKKARLLYTQKADATEAAKATETAYSNAWNSIDKTAHDVFINVMSNGQNAFTAIGKTIKAAILDMLYQLTIKKWLISIGVSMFGGGFAQAAGVAGNAASGVGSAGALFNSGSLVTEGAASLYSSGAKLFSAGLEKLGSSMMDVGNWISSNSEIFTKFTDGLGYANAAIQAFKGNWGAAAGSAIGAYFGGPIGSAIGNWLGSALDKAFAGESRVGGQYGVAYDGKITNQRRGETYEYEGQKYNVSGPQTTRLTSGQAYLQEAGGLGTEGDKAITKAVAGTAKAIDDTLSALGSKLRTTGYWAGLETSGKGRGGVFAGGTLSDGSAFGSSGKGDNYAGTLYDQNFTTSPDAATATANFALDLKMSYVKALQAANDIPTTISDMLKDDQGKLLDVGKMTSDEVDALIKTITGQIDMVQSFNAFADAMPLDSLKKLSFDAASGLIKLAGGLDTLTSQLNSYYQNYYSADEQQTQRLANLKKSFESVGLTMGDMGTDLDAAKARFRALMDAQDLSTESGRKAYAMLLQTQQAYLDSAQYAADAAKAAKEAAQKAADDQQKALQTAADNALKVLQKSVDAQKAVLQTQIDSLTVAASVAQESLTTIGKVFDIITSNVKELYGQVSSTAAQQLSDAQNFIATAVATAMGSSGYLPDADQLSAAVATVRAADNFKTTYEADKARLTLAAQLSVLGDSATAQKSIAQQQLDAANAQIEALKNQQSALDDIYKKAQEQLDAANGNIVATKSVADAVNALNDAIATLMKVNVPTKPQSAATTNAGGGSSSGPSFGPGDNGSGGAAAVDPNAPSGNYWPNGDVMTNADFALYMGAVTGSGGPAYAAAAAQHSADKAPTVYVPTKSSTDVSMADNSPLVTVLANVAATLEDIKKTTDANYYIQRAVTQNGTSISTSPAV